MTDHRNTKNETAKTEFEEIPAVNSLKRSQKSLKCCEMRIVEKNSFHHSNPRFRDKRTQVNEFFAAAFAKIT